MFHNVSYGRSIWCTAREYELCLVSGPRRSRLHSRHWPALALLNIKRWVSLQRSSCFYLSWHKIKSYFFYSIKKCVRFTVSITEVSEIDLIYYHGEDCDDEVTSSDVRYRMAVRWMLGRLWSLCLRLDWRSWLDWPLRNNQNESLWHGYAFNTCFIIKLYKLMGSSSFITMRHKKRFLKIWYHQQIT